MDSEKNDKLLYPLGYEPEIKPDSSDPKVRNQLIDFILKSGPSELIDTDLFAVMAKRRSTRKFSNKDRKSTRLNSSH